MRIGRNGERVYPRLRVLYINNTFSLYISVLSVIKEKIIAMLHWIGNECFNFQCFQFNEFFQDVKRDSGSREFFFLNKYPALSLKIKLVRVETFKPASFFFAKVTWPELLSFTDRCHTTPETSFAQFHCLLLFTSQLFWVLSNWPSNVIISYSSFVNQLVI